MLPSSGYRGEFTPTTCIVSHVEYVCLYSEGTERPRAYVVRVRPDVTAQSIQDYVSDRVIKYKHLTGGVVFVDSIPKSTSGKILRRELRERAKAELQVKDAKAKL